MRRISILLALLFILPQWSALASEMDGNLSDWPANSLMDTDSNGVSLYLDWDSSNLSIGWNGTAWGSISTGADLFVYFNTSEGGSLMSKDWNGAKSLPFAADFALVLEDSNYAKVISYDGDSWVDIHTPINFTGYESNMVTEISIPLSVLGSPELLEVISWAQWQDAGTVWTAFPLNNSLNQFRHFYHVENMSTSSPSDFTVMEKEGIEKESDALNLAIIFHQHQPYYKNKLTGMYEMPWVRVHSMAEYVDSPGILERYPETKITYNLVPSLMEQLLDYHRNETLDVHTDIAKRPWPEGDYPNATDLELHTMQFQSFWNSGWIYNVSEDDVKLSWLYPSSYRYSQIYDLTMHNLKPATIMDDTLLSPQDFLDLQVLWYLYQFSPDYVLGIYDSSHRDEGLISLFESSGPFNHSDLMYVIDAQHQHMGNVLPMYSQLAASGQVELTTTPYYHPIMPLLMQPGWTMEDGIYVDKDAWPEDVTHQLESGMNLFEDEIGFRPVGMWPSEEAVSPAMVQPVFDVGIEWMVTDEELLMKSTDMNGVNVDTDDAANLAMPWVATGEDGGEVAVVFRDRVISDRVAWQYGAMSPEAAVTDFISYIDNVRDQLKDAGEDPSEHLLTVSMDGENWMFMSEFQHNDNGRPFVDEWFSRLESHPSIVTTTPSEFLAKNLTLPHIDTIGTGSWVDGTLQTWAGEAEESLGWQRLIEARRALVAFEADNPSHSGLSAAWESLYIAEGSDWYWWYGLDQDSGYDENWDVLFKVHLSNIYRAINLELPPYLQELWTNPAIPEVPYGGIIEPMIDGIALLGEWDGAARYDAPIDGGDFDIESFHLGYDSRNVYVRIDTNESEREGSQKALEIYFMQANAVNFNEAQTNFRTLVGQEIIGFPAKYMIRFDYDELRDDNRAKWNLYTAKGKISGVERWTSSGASSLGGCAYDEIYEFEIPWSDIGLAPRYSTRIKVVTAWVGDTDEDAEMAPPAPAEMVLPELEEWVTLLQLNDTVGDENGDGNYTYPLASDFAPGVGLFDATKIKIEQSDWNARFTISMSEITNYWGLTNGFSHQIIQIYVDKGDSEYGETSMLLGANAEVHPDWAWEVAISGTGEPGAVFAVQAETGSTSNRGVEVEGDKDAKTITFTVSKDVIGTDVGSYRYIVVVGSQDGFGTGKWRDVDATAKTWTLGGGADPAPDDGIDYDPNIIDVILDGEGQTEMLSSYSVEDNQFAILTGFEIPEVPQQIFGAKVLAVTDTTAMIAWSTTKSAVGSLDCGGILVEGQYSETTTHSLTVSGLEKGQSRTCTIFIDDAEPVDVTFTTANETDTTAPQILNIRIETLVGGTTTISWFTSEDTSGTIDIGNIHLNTESMVSKNHEITIADLCVGIHKATITVQDASGNQAENTHTFTVSGDWDECTINSGGKITVDETASLLSNTTIQIVALVVILLVFASLFRTRREQFQ